MAYSLQQAFNCPLRTVKMPQSRALLNRNTFIVMDLAAEALLNPQVSTLLLAVQNFTFVNSASDLTQE